MLQGIKVFLLFSEVILGTAYGWLSIREVFLTWSILTIVELSLAIVNKDEKYLSPAMQSITQWMLPIDTKEAQHHS